MNFFKYIVKLVIYLFSPIILLTAVIISYFKVIRICFLPAHRIGEIVGGIEIYLSEKQFQFNKNTLDLFFLTDKIANKFLINLIKKYSQREESFLKTENLKQENIIQICSRSKKFVIL